MSIAGILSGVLPDTATHTDCRWEWAPRLDEPDTRDGTLRVEQAARGRRETSVYAVEEQPPLPFFIGRAFLLANLTSDDGDVYETLIGPTEAHCSCKAGKTRAPHCKHRDALRALMADGLVTREQPGELHGDDSEGGIE